MNRAVLHSFRSVNKRLIPKSSFFIVCDNRNIIANKNNHCLTQQIRCYSRRARYNPQYYDSNAKFVKPTLFVIAGVGGMIWQLMINVVTYSTSIIISEEKSRHAMKKFPAFFNRGMQQLGFGTSSAFLFLLIHRWNDLWRRYELLMRTKYQRDNSINEFFSP